jgi:hypothetical protein
MDEVDALSSSACKLSLFRLACHAVMDTVHLGCAYQPEVRHPVHGLIRGTLFSMPMSRPVQLAHRVVIIGVLTPRVVAIITRSVIPSSHRASSFVDATAEPVFFFSSFGHRIALFRFATSCSMALRYYDQHHNAVDDIHREPRSTLTAAVLLPMIFFSLFSVSHFTILGQRHAALHSHPSTLSADGDTSYPTPTSHVCLPRYPIPLMIRTHTFPYPSSVSRVHINITTHRRSVQATGPAFRNMFSPSISQFHEVICPWA